MKRRFAEPVLILAVFLLIISVGFSGCKSAPDNSSAVADLLVDIEKIRQLDIDEGFDAVFPDKWGDAEASFESAKPLAETGSGEAVTALQEVYNLYQEIYDLGMAARSQVPDETENLAEQLANARNRALEAGAGDMFKTEFDALEAKVLPSLEGGDDTAAEAYRNQIAAYEALEYLSYAGKKAKIIEERGLASYDEASYNSGNTAFQEALPLISSDPVAARDNARSALESYQLVIDTAYRILGEEAEKSLLKEKELCDSIKAQISMKDAYAACEASYARGLEQKNSGKFEESYFIFEGLISEYRNVYEQANAKREAALAAMQAASDKQAGVRELALEADKIAPLEGEDEPEYELPEENLSVEEIEAAGFVTVEEAETSGAVTEDPQTEDSEIQAVDSEMQAEDSEEEGAVSEDGVVSGTAVSEDESSGAGQPESPEPAAVEVPEDTGSPDGADIETEEAN